IALDHTQHLGSTLEAIAAEKAGILKPDSVAITAAQPPALAIIESVARERQIPLLRLGNEIQVAVIDKEWAGIQVTVTTPADTYRDLRVPLLGLHQAENAALAVAAIDGLRSRGWDISDGALRDGLARTRWPGRLEVIDRHPDRKSTRLNSSHVEISYAVFCLKKKKKKKKNRSNIISQNPRQERTHARHEEKRRYNI